MSKREMLASVLFVVGMAIITAYTFNYEKALQDRGWALEDDACIILLNHSEAPHKRLDDCMK